MPKELRAPQVYVPASGVTDISGGGGTMHQEDDGQCIGRSRPVSFYDNFKVCFIFRFHFHVVYRLSLKIVEFIFLVFIFQKKKMYYSSILSKRISTQDIQNYLKIM